MKTIYEKPIIIVNNDFSEGVYTASGTGDVSANIHQEIRPDRVDYRVQVNCSWKDMEAGSYFKMIIEFSDTVYISNEKFGTDLCSYTSGSGSTKLEFTVYAQNSSGNVGFGDLIVTTSAASLSVLNTYVTK